ncbi:MAG: hypothetical protein AAFP17_17025 [Pseudomonadota bacterium]
MLMERFQPWPERRQVIVPLRGLARVSTGVSARERARGFPRILAGQRRGLFARLLANGACQAGGALALPLLLSGSGGLGAIELAGGLALLAGLQIALRVQELRDAERLGLDYVAEVRLRLFDGLVEGRGTAHGVAMSRLMNDLSALRQWVGLGLARSVSGVLAFAGCAGAAALMSPAHLGVILLPAVFVLGAGAVVLLTLAAKVREVRRRRGKLARLLGENLLSLPDLGQPREARAARRRVARASGRLNDALSARIRAASVLRVLPDAVLPLSLIGAVAWGLGAGGGQLGVVLLAGLAAGPLTQLLRAAEYRIAYTVARERLCPGLGRGQEGP